MAKENNTAKIIIVVAAVLVAAFLIHWIWAHLFFIIVIAAIGYAAYCVVGHKALSGGRKTLP